MIRFIIALLKIAVVSMITGALLSWLDISAERLLGEVGLTPEAVFAYLEHGARWAIPNIVLGSFVVLPVWLVVFLFRPPRG